MNDGYGENIQNLGQKKQSGDSLQQEKNSNTQQAFLEGYKYAIQILEDGLVNVKKTR